MPRPLSPASLLTVAVLWVPWGSSDAQSFPVFGGFEVRGGVSFPENAEAGPTFAGELDLGYALTPALRTLLTVNRFSADIDREPGGDEGSYRATAVSVGTRYDFLPRTAVAPYLRGALLIQRVSADAFDTDVGALLEGSYVGFAAALGARYMIDQDGRFSATAEVHRALVNNVANTAIAVGMRIQPRGLRSYRRELRSAALPVPAEVAQTSVAVPGAGAQPIRDTADVRLAREAAARAEVGRTRDAAAERERTAELLRLRAIARESMLRQGLGRAAVIMRNFASFSESEHAFVIAVGGAAFTDGASTLATTARDQLRVLATVLAGYPGHIVNIEGHSDSTGDRRLNQLLSEERAAAIRAALIAEGVDPLWVAALGRGPDHPLASNATAEGRAANRRVEIRVSRRPCASLPAISGTGELICPR